MNGHLLFQTDLTGKVLWVSASTGLPFTLAEFAGSFWFNFVNESERATCVRSWDEAVVDRSPFKMQVTLLLHNRLWDLSVYPDASSGSRCTCLLREAPIKESLLTTLASVVEFLPLQQITAQIAATIEFELIQNEAHCTHHELSDSRGVLINRKLLRSELQKLCASVERGAEIESRITIGHLTLTVQLSSAADSIGSMTIPCLTKDTIESSIRAHEPPPLPSQFERAPEPEQLATEFEQRDVISTAEVPDATLTEPLSMHIQIERPSILIVEDNPTYLKTLYRQLSSLPCQFHLAKNGEEAFRVIAEHPINIALIDRTLPLYHERPVGEQIKDTCRNVILISMESRFNEKKETYFDYQLIKPIKPEHIQEIVERVMLP